MASQRLRATSNDLPVLARLLGFFAPVRQTSFLLCFCFKLVRMNHQTWEVAGGVVLFLIIIGLRIAREYERGVIFRLGRYAGIRGPGLYWIIPFGIERSSI